MKVAVWDTYVTRKDGLLMHFDIIVPEHQHHTETIYAYGREYLVAKGQAGQPLASEQCRFCHMEQMNPEQETEISRKGYFILEMENCR